MSWADFAILAVIIVSALISLLRGFVREAISLLGWILAFWFALSFTEVLASFLTTYISLPSLRLAVAFLALFSITLILTGLVNFLAGQLVDKTGLTGTDRALGMIFGVVRGALLVAVLVLLAGLTALPEESWWHESILIGHFQRLALEIRSLFPSNVAEYFEF